MMPTLSSLLTPQVVITTTCSAASEIWRIWQLGVFSEHHALQSYTTEIHISALFRFWISLDAPVTFFLDKIQFHHDFHHDSCDHYWNFYGHSLLVGLHLRLSVTKCFWFCKCSTPWMFLPLDIIREYWIEHVTFGPLYVMFTFPTRIFYREVPGFATDCPCGVWCRGLTTCLLYVGSF